MAKIALVLSLAIFIADMVKSGYLELISTQDIPTNSIPEFAQILKGNDKDCLTKPTQTQSVSVEQIRTLRQLADKKKVGDLLGNAYCETAKGMKYVTESGKELTVKFDEILDYDFNSRAASKTLLSRPPKEGMAGQREPKKIN